MDKGGKKRKRSSSSKKHDEHNDGHEEGEEGEEGEKGEEGEREEGEEGEEGEKEGEAKDEELPTHIILAKSGKSFKLPKSLRGKFNYFFKKIHRLGWKSCTIQDCSQPG